MGALVGVEPISDRALGERCISCVTLDLRRPQPWPHEHLMEGAARHLRPARRQFACRLIASARCKWRTPAKATNVPSRRTDQQSRRPPTTCPRFREGDPPGRSDPEGTHRAEQNPCTSSDASGNESGRPAHE